MTLLVRDEADVIEENLVYHLESGVDFVVATDNGSTDGTLEVLERYAAQGLLHLLHEADRDHRQDVWVSRMAQLAATELHADWVLNCDADEFWVPIGGTLKEVLAAVPERFGAITVPRSNFLDRPDGERPFYERMVVTEVTSVNPRREGRPLKAKVLHRATPDAELVHGNHRVSGTGVELLPGWRPIEILHFPARSYAQYERKMRHHGEARHRPEGLDAAEAEGKSSPVSGFTQVYERYLAGELPGDYERGLLSDEEVEAGLNESRLAPDRRLQRFFADRRERSAAEHSGTALVVLGAELRPAPPERRDRVEELRLEALRALDRHRVDAADVSHELARERARTEKALSAAAKEARSRRRAESQLEALRSDPSQRLLAGAAPLRRGVAAAARVARTLLGRGRPPAR